MLREFLRGDFGLGHMISAFTFQLCCLDSMWRANSALAPTSERHLKKKKNLSDDRKQANDFYAALTALVKFSLTKPCLDVREFNRNCQISFRNHNSLYRWKHVRQSAVVDLKGSAQPPLTFVIFCHLDPVCFIFAGVKLAELLYRTCLDVESLMNEQGCGVWLWVGFSISPYCSSITSFATSWNTSTTWI